MLTDFRDKVALVTGAAGGIGLGMTRALAEAGMNVAMVDVDEKVLAESVSLLRQDGASVIGLPLDVTDRAGWAEIAGRVSTDLGPIQVLCNNAGVSTLGLLIDDVTPEIWDKVVEINLTGVFNGVKACLDQMRAAGSGHIVNTSSMGGLVGFPSLSPYVATKFAVVGFSESLRAELAGDGIGVSVLCPGSVRSRLWRTSRKVRGLPDIETPPDDMSGQSASSEALDPYLVGLQVVDAIRDNKLYIVTDAQQKSLVATRSERILRAFDRLEKQDS